MSRDRKRLIVALPHEVWIVHRKDLTVQRRIPVPAAVPSVTEDLSGKLWFGGGLLHEGSSWGDQVTKLGTKLSGFVDHVRLLRPGLLCGVGTGGQVLWDLEKDGEVHRRRAAEGEVTALVATADERAVFAQGGSQAWVIDPNHPTGYAQLRFKETSPTPQPAERIEAVGVSSTGRIILAARDGGVAVTSPDLRLHRAWHLGDARAGSLPLAVVADAHFIYALRPHGRLDRFCVEAPAQEDGSPGDLASWPPVTAELSRAAVTMTLAADDGDARLWLGGARAHGQLGSLWPTDPARLSWQPLSLRARELVETPPAERPAAPSFVATRNKVEGPTIGSITVDQLLGRSLTAALTTGRGALKERPYTPLTESHELLPADTLLLPAMFRFREGTARPGMVVWSGTTQETDPVPPLRFLTWGADPSVGWVELSTPDIRAQRWTRTDVFPLQVALSASVGPVPGRRARLPRGWDDTELFAALARECQKAMKVVW